MIRYLISIHAIVLCDPLGNFTTLFVTSFRYTSFFIALFVAESRKTVVSSGKSLQVSNDLLRDLVM